MKKHGNPKRRQRPQPCPHCGERRPILPEFHECEQCRKITLLLSEPGIRADAA